MIWRANFLKSSLSGRSIRSLMVPRWHFSGVEMCTTCCPVMRSVPDAGTAALPVICSIAGDAFVFQQDNAPSHCAYDTIELLCPEIPNSLIVICSQPVLTWIQCITVSGTWCSSVCITCQSRMWTSCISDLLRHGLNASPVIHAIDQRQKRHFTRYCGDIRQVWKCLHSTTC